MYFRIVVMSIFRAVRVRTGRLASKRGKRGIKHPFSVLEEGFGLSRDLFARVASKPRRMAKFFMARARAEVRFA